jgi:phosphate transport system protein
MPKRLERAIDGLKKEILALSAIVENKFHQAIKAIQDRNPDLARSIIEGDVEVDEKEVDIEEECLKLLALYQPVAHDLRFIVAVLKINGDLERIGDLAVNIAEHASFFANQPKVAHAFDMPAMAEKVKRMLKQALDSLVARDANAARTVCEADDEVDEIHRGNYDRIENAIVREPQQVRAYIHQLAVSRYLERIADHATNIAEDVIYMVEGEIRRHHL